jgi:plastocyanin
MKRIIVAAAVTALGVAALALPATAATPSFSGSVGPGFTISLAKKPTKPGLATFVINDKATTHNWHLHFGAKKVKVYQVDAKGKTLLKNGKRVEATTSVGATDTVRFTVKLQRGKYTFLCDPHSTSLVGTFTVK